MTETDRGERRMARFADRHIMSAIAKQYVRPYLGANTGATTMPETTADSEDAFRVTGRKPVRRLHERGRYGRTLENYPGPRVESRP